MFDGLEASDRWCGLKWEVVCLDVATTRATPPPRHDVVTHSAAVTRGPAADSVMKSVESLMFADEDTDAGQYMRDVLLAVQRWFTSNGWPNSANIITIPHSLSR